MFTTTDFLFISCIITLMIFMILLYTSPEKTCEPQIIYKTMPEQLLDEQFSEKNIPTIVYEDMFSQGSPWIGGYTI